MTTKNRLFFSVGANGIKAALSLVLGMLVARSLGPENYGDLAFLLGSFWAIRALLDMGMGSAFYTFISQKDQDRKYYLVHFMWLACQFLFSLFLIGLLLPESLLDRIWLGQERELIVWALLATFLQNQVWQTVIQAYESERKTSRIQIASLCVILVQLIVVLSFVVLSSLSVLLFLKIISVEYFLFTTFMCLRLGKEHREKSIQEENPSFNVVVTEYYHYCRPLVIVGMMSFVYEIADRWLLQRYGGSDQQAFYQVAMQLSVVSVLVTTSILNVLWKEIAESNKNGDDARVIDLYHRLTRMLIATAMFFSCFLAPWAEEIVVLLLGADYKDAWPALFIMLFYPIHQCLGQINGTLFRATGVTSLLMRITVVSLLASLPLSYFLIAPTSEVTFPGLELGALGLAIKVVGLNIVFVNIESWFISRRYGSPFKWRQQITGTIVFLTLGYCSKFVGINAFPGGSAVAVIVGMVISGSVFTVISIWGVKTIPKIFGIEKIDVDEVTTHLKSLYVLGRGQR
ncbi:lipopolysaccharide biosynthesis protein [Pseudomonadales bacterium]|nr:lipopolysaccharide biosynthesis protein [Pseudomonadales bacterium]